MANQTDEPKPCYLCARYAASKVVNDIPVCELCDHVHLEPERRGRKEAVKKRKAPPPQEKPKEEEDVEFDLNWDVGELDTQPGWGGFGGIKP